MSAYHDQMVAAIAAEVLGRLPVLRELVETTNSGEMGPDNTTPAVWMSLLLSDREIFKLRSSALESEATIRERQSAGSLPL